MKNKGQSTVEYVLLVSAVLGVIIYLTTTSSSPFQQKLTNTVNMTMGSMETEANKLTAAINQ